MNTKGWHAWIDKVPPPPDDLHVVGEVEVANPGVEATLQVRNPQGINPAILLLDLHLKQRPGHWLQVLTWAPVHYTQELPAGSTCYTSVEIFYDNQSIVQRRVHSETGDVAIATE